MVGEDESLQGSGAANRTSGERRQHRRVAMLSNVTLRIQTARGDDDDAALVRSGTTGDVSLGGMFVEASDPMSPGTRLEARFALPDRDAEVEIPAEVRWSRKPGHVSEPSPWKFGIHFLELTDHQQQLLEDFVGHRAGR